MTYPETIAWLFLQLPMYQQKGKVAYKADLSNSLLLDQHLSHPHLAFKTIHVAGTNGKGSTCHMLASVLQEAGYTVGLYTSPHLKDFRERIRVNGEMISKKNVQSFVEKHKDFFEQHHFSFFEMTVGLAFNYFQKQKVDIAIIETGLGGRLDSTNIITPMVSVITNIGYDHQQFLGDTLTKIASEKAGIIKPRTPVIIGETQHETKDVFMAFAEEDKSPIYFADQDNITNYESDLKGVYQQKNQKTVLKTLEILIDKGFSISEKHKTEGLKNVVANTGLKGRWHVLQERPKVICDTAHNQEGLTLVLDQLAQENYKHLHIVLGTLRDKDLSKLLLLFPKTATYYFCSPTVERGLAAEVLKREAEKYGLAGSAFSSVLIAYNEAIKEANQDDVIFIGGSTFTVAEIV
ncbi:folylpolyglutamate synthase/dihydrofolate synthase family protein [Gangjinia marincola]|uniref:Dihydrofolate synthase/folylpolyglutamate synthase n=1 Tax=Gangjinia marincola TaxID=578463 RepID=A0ABN1MKB2_9FLAO